MKHFSKVLQPIQVCVVDQTVEVSKTNL